MLSDTAAVVVKYDQRRPAHARGAAPARRPERDGAGARARPWARHGHGHGHDDDQHHDPVDPAVDDGEIDGRAVRAAKDAEGRHDAGYYRTRDSVQPDRPTAPEAEGDGGPRHPQLRRRPGPQARAVSAGPSRAKAALGAGLPQRTPLSLHRAPTGRADGERAAPVRAAAAAAAGADLDPRGARRHGLRPRAGDARRQGAPQGRPARRADQGPARRGGLRRGLRPVLRAGEGRAHGDGPRPRARPRRPLRHRRARGLHALRGAERDPAAGPQPRQAGRHPRLLRPRGPRPAVQPAPGGQQDRPGRDDRGDRALEGQPGHPGREGNRVQIETDRLSYAGAAGPDLPAAGHEGRRRPVGRRAGGAAGLAQRRRGRGRQRGHRGRRGGAAPPAHRRPRRAARGDQAAPGGAARAGAADRRVERAGASPRSTGSASTSGWSWRSRCAGSPTRCTAG